MGRFLDYYSITTGCVRTRDRAYIVAANDELAKENIADTRLYGRYRGVWGSNDYKWVAISTSVCHVPAERFITIGESGQVGLMGGGEAIEERVPHPEKKGPLREVRGIAGGRAYVVGTERQVYRRDAANQWADISVPGEIPNKQLLRVGFNSIDGFSETDIYAVGWGGDMWHYDGKLWTQCPSPTKLALYKVRCAGDGNVYACGQLGTLVRGRADKWQIISRGVTKEHLWGMEWFGNRLYASTLNLVYELAGETLQLVDFSPEVPPDTCYHLSGADGIMWSIGSKDIMQFDGKKWERIDVED